MAGQVDKRIIQMQFENREFEKNIAKSQKSVEDLKQAMDFEQTSKGLSKFAESFKNIDLSALTDNVQKLTDKFTGLGNMGELVVSQIRRKIEEAARAVSGFIDSMTTQQVSAGMNKYEMLNRSVQTIKAATGRDEGDVYKVLQRLNEYTDQTSYNFSDMAQNIGKFTSVGISLEAAEKQMEGIANWAARSGAGINEASRAMYNLSQAMGVGKMTLIDWKSIENAGMATKEFKEQLIQAGIAAGTLVNENGVVKTAKSLGKQVEVNFQNMSQSFNKGWATSAVISSTLEKYYYDDLFYEQTQEAILQLDDAQKKSFDSMIESGEKLDKEEWKQLEDISGMTEETKKKILELAVSQGKLTAQTDRNGKTIYKTTNKTGKKIEFTIDNIQESLQAGWFDKGFAESVTSIDSLARSSYEAAQKCLTFTDVLGAWKDQISTGWMTSFKIIFGELSESMEFFSNVCNSVADVIGELIDLRNNALKVWSESGGRNNLLKIILGDFGSDVETGSFGLLDMLTGAKDLLFNGFKDFMMLFGRDIDKKAVAENPEYFSTYLGYLLSDTTRNIKNFMTKIKEFFNEDIEVNGKTTTRLEIIQNIVSGIAGAIKLGYDIVTKTIEFLGKLGKDISPGLDSLLGFFGDLGKSIYDTAEETGGERSKFTTFFNDLRETVKPLTEAVSALLTAFSGLFRTIFGLDEEGATQTKTLEKIGNVIKTVASIITKVASPVINFISKIITLVGDLFKEGINADSLKKFAAGLGEGFGDMMKSFADALPEKLSFIRDWIHKIFGDGGDALKKETDSLFGVLGGIKDKVKGLFSGSKQNANQNAAQGQNGNDQGIFSAGNILAFFGIGGGLSVLAGIISVVLLLKKVRKAVGQIGSFFGTLKDTLKEGIKIKMGNNEEESFATKFLKIAGAIALVAACIFALGSMPLSSLIQGGIAIVVIVGIMFGLFKLLEKSAEGGELSSSLAFAAKVTALAFSMVALSVAVGILTLALIPFTLMSWEQFGKAMAGLGSILAMMVGFMLLIKVLKIDTVKLAGFAGFAFSLGILVKSIMPFTKLSWDQYAKAMAGLGGVLLELIAAMTLMSVLPIGTAQLGGFIAFALSIGILIYAIMPFTKLSWDEFGKAMAGLGAVLLELIAAMTLMSVLPIGTAQLGGFIAFALSIGILVYAILPFTKLSWREFGKAMAGLGGVLLELIAAMLLMSVLPIGTKQLGGFIMFALSIGLLIQVIMPFTKLSWEEYGKAMAGLGGVLLELIAAMGLMSLMPIGTGQLGGFIMFALSMMLLINAIMPFTTLSWDQYGKAMAGLGGVLLELIAFMGLMKLIGTNSANVAGLMGFAYGLSSLIKAIMPFKDMSWEEYAKTMAGLGGVLLVMIGFLAIVKYVKPDLKNMGKMLIFSVMFAGIAGVFAGCLKLVKDVDWEVIAAFAAGLSVLVIAMAAGAALADLVGIKGFAILAAGLILVMGAIALIVPLLIGNVMGALRNAAGDLAIIGDLMGTFSSKMDGVGEGGFDKAERIIDKIGSIIIKIAKFMFQAGSTSELMIAIASLVITADEMIKFDTKMQSLSADGGTAKAIGIITAYEGMFTEHLIKFSDYIAYSSFFYDAMFKLGSAFDYFNSMTENLAAPADNNGLNLIKELAGCAPNLDTIYKMDLDKFRDQLAELGGAMIIYAKGAESVAGKEITADTDIGGAITLLQKISTNLSEAGGFSIPENMPEDKELTAFGVQLAALAGALVAFEEAGQGLGAGTERALATLDFFYQLKLKLQENANFGSDLSDAIGSFKGENGEFIQKDELTQFGEDIAQLGSAMAHFAESTQIIDEETKEAKPLDFTKATEALESIVGLNDKLPALGGVKDAVEGEKQTLKDLATQIELLGTALNEFYNSTTKVNDGSPEALDFSKPQDFLKSIVDMQEKLAKIKLGGLASLFEGDDMTFDKLSSQLVVLGAGLSTLSDSISGEDEETHKKRFDGDSASAAVKLLDSDIVPFMLSLSKTLPKVGGLGNIISTVFTGREMNLTDLGGQLGGLGDGLGQFGEKISGKFQNADDVTNAIKAIDGIIGLMVQLSNASNLAGAGSVTDAAYGLNTFLQAFLNGIQVEGEGSNYYSGLEAMIEIAEWISGELKKVPDISIDSMQKFNLLAEALANLSSIDLTKSEQFENVGLSIITGMANGIKNNISLITIAAENAAMEAYTAAMAKLDANSPSKVFMDVGSYIGLGMAIGIDKSNGEVKDAATGMTEEAIDSASNMLGLISRIMAEGVVDEQPTISPVLDLTNIREGMKDFQSSLNNGYSVNLDTTLSAARAASTGAFKSNEDTLLKPDYTGIYERMDILGSQIVQMEDSIKKMKLVLDTGVIAGGVTDRVDELIGQKIWLLNRGNTV